MGTKEMQSNQRRSDLLIHHVSDLIPTTLFKPTKDETGIPTFYYKYQEVPEHLKHLPDRVGESFIGKSVLITGGSGYLGKLIVEKLLRKCPNIGRIYLLMRPKKGKSPAERLNDLFSLPVFNLLKEKQGEKVFEKVSVISGDVAEIDLGISTEDRALLCDTVNIVYHSAATISFDEPLRKAVITNTRATKFMLDLARQMKQLEVFIHVSTAYCQADKETIEEKAYPPPQDPHKMIQLCELLEENEMECIKTKLMIEYPNTYAFSKSLAEGLVNEAIEEGLPCLIGRPSIILPTWMEPIPGWTDIMTGPAGLSAAVGKGVLRTVYMKSDVSADYIPLDYCVNVLLLMSFCFVHLKKPNRICNITTGAEFRITFKELFRVGIEITRAKAPFCGCVWYPGVSLNRSKFWNNICVILFHMIPAYFIDGLIYLSGNSLVNVHKRLIRGFEVYDYYVTNEWNIKKDNIIAMQNDLNDREIIEYKINMENLILEKYLEDAALGGRQYLLKQDPSTIPSARAHLRMLYWVDRIVKVLLTIFFIWFVYNYTGSFVKFFVTIYQLMLHIISFFTEGTSAPSSLPLPINSDL